MAFTVNTVPPVCPKCSSDMIDKCTSCTGLKQTCFTYNVVCFGGKGWKCPNCYNKLNSVDDNGFIQEGD